MTRQDAQARKQRKELQKIWDANGAAIYEANREYKAKHGMEMDAAARSKAIKDATRNGVFNAGAYAFNLETEKTRQDAQNERMASKMTRIEKEEEVRWQAPQKAAEEKQKAEELQAGYAAYYAAMRQGEETGAPKVNSALVPEKKSWWQKSLDWIDNHQAEIALGVGIVVGVGAIILSGGTATPLVAAAWIAEAAVVAGGTVALGTIGLNSYYGRAWNENVGRNLAISAVAAAVVTGAGLLLTGNALLRVGNGVAGYCATHPEVCARADVVLKTLDKVEEAGLILKGAVQTARGDSVGAAETHLELQLEYLDGGAPGNTVAAELTGTFTRYGDDAIDLVQRYGDDTTRYLNEVADIDLAQVTLEQGYQTSKLADEFDISISIIGRHSDTPAEIAWRAKAAQRMKELQAQGVDFEIAKIQAAAEFGILPHQVRASDNKPEVDVFIPIDIWEQLPKSDQENIKLKLIEIFNTENDPKFTVDFRQLLTPKPDWPDPATTNAPGGITFNPNGSVVHEPFGE